MQSSQTLKVIQITQLHDPYLCPVQALQILLRLRKCSHLDPLFVVPRVLGQWVPVSPCKVRATLATILVNLKLNDRNLGFHAFRWFGASFAFNQNIHLQNI